MITITTAVAEKVAITVAIVPKVEITLGVSVPTVIAPTTVRLLATFKLNGALFDPQNVQFIGQFVPSTLGVPSVMLSSLDSVAIVRTGLGSYYVELTFPLPGKLKFIWQSTAISEESTAENSLTVSATSVPT